MKTGYEYARELFQRNEECRRTWDKDDAFTELDRANAGEDRRCDALRIMRKEGFRA